MPKKTLTVFGATGNQGGSVLSTVLSTPSLHAKYALRAVTRNPSSAAAQALAAQGVALVQADLNDPASVSAAVKGSSFVFGATDFMSAGAAEYAQGIAIADACLKDGGVEHLVWSSLPHATSLSGGEMKGMVHFDRKADVEAFVERRKGAAGMRASYYLPAVFMSNLLWGVKKGEEGDGVVRWAGPMKPEGRIPWVDVKADTGKWVLGLLEKGAEADGVSVNGVGEWLSPDEAMEVVGKTVGAEYRFQQLDREVFKQFCPPGIEEELTETLELTSKYQYYGLDAEGKQDESDKWLLEGSTKTGLKQFVASTGPWPQ